jgi:hypothetical protein
MTFLVLEDLLDKSTIGKLLCRKKLQFPTLTFQLDYDHYLKTAPNT